MKVLLVNGSPHKKGSTYTLLAEAASAIEELGVEVEFFDIGNGPFYGCIACHACDTTGRCRFEDDPANALAKAAETADGFIFGSPVYYAGANGALCAVLDRAFYSQGRHFAGKPGAAVSVARRAGTGETVDRLNKYFTINQMPVASSIYWNGGHGAKASDVKQDLEGMQTMRVLGRNLARLVKQIDATKETIPAPDPEPRVWTNFIR
jgi:multimeric flavodoxin WrbA